VRWNESQAGKVLVLFAIICFVMLILNWRLELIRDADKIAQLLGPNGNQSYFPY
jgi:hypothetical protein